MKFKFSIFLYENDINSPNRHNFWENTYFNFNKF
jgi:hypothetical protein